MFYYVYYGYLSYLLLRYTPTLELTYYTIYYGNRICKWVIKKEEKNFNEDDWVLCDMDDFVIQNKMKINENNNYDKSWETAQQNLME
tara:strand:+ start:222 stop:482 length:261 start_codon:yes stop_codon:yes gene_type:complete